MEFLSSLLAKVRPGDLIDIAVIALLFYACLSWLQQRTSGAFLLVLAGVAGLFGLAHIANMYLTLQVFQAGLSLIVIALVVIFQQDLRRGFEALGNWSLLRRKGPTSVGFVDTLTDAVNLLATQRTGALIVLRGREPLEQHLRGGISLKGRISVPLLHSIFDTHSRGHDGAVLVERARIEKFAVQLPLSQSMSKLINRGTRHTAALGLAERSDALVLVVSEERGSISIAHEGELSQLTNLAQVKERLTTFWETHYPSNPPSWFRTWFTRNLGLKVLSLATACFLWFFLAYRVETVQRSFDEVPVEYRNLPKQWVMEEDAPTKIKVTLSGPERVFTAFDAKKLKMAVDLSKPKIGTYELTVKEDLLNLPADLHIVGADTPLVRFRLYKETQATLPIRVRIEGKVSEGYRLGTIETRPAKVNVFLPVNKVSAITHIDTYPILVEHWQKDEKLQVILDLPEDTRYPQGKQPMVVVTVPVKKIEEKKQEK